MGCQMTDVVSPTAFFAFVEKALMNELVLILNICHRVFPWSWKNNAFLAVNVQSQKMGN